MLEDEQDDPNDMDESFVSKLDGGAAGVKYIETDEVISSLFAYHLSLYSCDIHICFLFCFRISMVS